MIELYEHQKKALELTRAKNKVAYYLDMGLGKTFVGSEKMKVLHEPVNLVICQASKVDDWVSHFRRYYPNSNIFNLRNKGELDMFNRIGGVGVINYDLIWRRKINFNRNQLTLMLDESSLIQNEKSKRSKAILKIKPKNVILLSGTPTGGKYEKLWSQMSLLGWNMSAWQFRNRYVVYQNIEISPGMEIPIIVGYKRVDELISKMRNSGCVFMKTEDVFDLPEVNHIPIKIKNHKNYHKFVKNNYVKHDGIEFVGEGTLTQMLYERQLASGYNKSKLDVLKDLLDSTDDRVIIFYNFTHEYERIKKLIGSRPLSVINGGRQELKNYDTESNSVTLVQYQAGAMGHNLQKANKIMYFSLPLSSELFEQSKKRTHRIGQDRACFYYYLITEDSIDEEIMNTLRKRKDYTDRLFQARRPNKVGMRKGIRQFNTNKEV